MIGFIVYETIDLFWNTCKIAYNISSYTYNWYYGIKNKHSDKEITDNDKNLKIQDLEDRIKKLEILLDKKK